METSLENVLEDVTLYQGVGKQSGKPYYMIVVKLEGNIEFRYLCEKGEDNVVKALQLAASKKA